MNQGIENRLAKLEDGVVLPACDKPGHYPLTCLFLVNGNAAEVAAKAAEIRGCERCGPNPDFVLFIFGNEVVTPTGWEGLPRMEQGT